MRAASVPQPSRCTPGKRTSIVRASGNSCRLDVCLLPETFVLSGTNTGNISAAFLPAHNAACSVALEIASPPTASPPLITITDAALKNLKRLREDAGNEKVLLRMGVRSGGCSGIPQAPDSPARFETSLPLPSRRAIALTLAPRLCCSIHAQIVVNWSHDERDCLICLAGMSYHMDFEDEANVRAEDMVMEYEGGFKLVCDPKSGLYLFGMRLDYSSALIGGGFQFHNPNAASSCGCGKSFGV